MPQRGKDIFAFGGFRADPQERTLTYGDQPVRTTPKVFDLLVCFLRHAGKLLTKQQLLDTVWCGVTVEESALARTVCDLRVTLARHDPTPFIETVAKFGYRFLGTVTVVEEESPPAGNGEARAASLKKPARAVGLFFAAGTVFLLLSLSVLRPSVPKQRMTSIAVLPFHVVGRVEDPEVFALGLADAVATRLGAVQDLVVRPASAAARYSGAAADPRHTARQLRVDGIVEGTMQIQDGRVRVTVRLIRGDDGLTAWSAEIERATGHAFELERDVAQEVAERVMAHAPPLQTPIAISHAEAPLLESYFRGRGFWMRRDRGSLDRAAAEFQRALALEPAFAPAHAGLADCFLLMGLYDYRPPAEMFPRARAEAEAALRLDPNSAPAYATLGLLTQNWERDFRAAEMRYRRSIAIDPNYATAHHWLAELLSVLGRFAEAEEQFHEAERIDPVSSIIRTDEAQLWYFARRFGRSRAILEQVLELDPDFQQAHEQMALLLAAQGREEEAWKQIDRLHECQAPNSLCRLRWSAWLPGRNAVAARDALRTLLRRAENGYVPPRVLAIAYARQGHAVEAAHWLSKAAQAHEVGVITIAVDPLLDPLRRTPAFLALQRELRIAPPSL